VGYVPDPFREVRNQPVKTLHPMLRRAHVRSFSHLGEYRRRFITGQLDGNLPA
jgi:hypothetical protein